MVQAVTREPRLPEVLGGLRMMVAQLRLYPKTSAQVAKVSTMAFPPLIAFLEIRRTMTIASAPEGLLVNGARFPAEDTATLALETAVLGLLREAGLKSFSLQAGATPEELIAFLHALAHKFWELRDGKKINLRLHEENVLHAAVDEVEYVELSKDDLLLKDAVPKLEAAGFETAELLKVIDERLEVAIEHGKGPEARAGIIRKALEQDPTLLGQIVRDGVTTARPGDAPGVMTADQALDAVRRIWKAMATASPETRQALRSVAESILEPFHGASAAYLAHILASEAPELLPGWMKESLPDAPEPSCVARAREILALSPEARAEALLREGKTLIQELAAAGRNDLIEKILGIPTERLESASSRHKTQAAETLRSWSDMLDSEPLAKACEALRKKLSPALDQEAQAPVYAKLVELAGILLDSRMQKHGAGGTGELLDTLRRHCAASDPAFPDRAGLARSVYSKFQTSAPAAPPVAMSASTAERVAAAFQAASVQFLIAQMKDMENVAERLELAETVSRMGPSAATLLSDELKKTKVPSEAIRLLEVLPWVATPEIAEQTLSTLLMHPVVMVRRRAALALVERKYAGAESILLGNFEAKEAGAKLAVIEALGKLGSEAALAKLRVAAESRDQADDVRSACCAALAHSADPKSIALLTTLASPPNRGLTRIFRSVSSVVRAAAVKALGACVTTEEGRSLLDRLTADPDPAVSAAAKEAVKPAARPKAGAAAAAPAPEAEPTQEIHGFSGLISEIGLDQICQVIGTSRKTGLLLVNFEGPTARVYFDKGLIVAAEFESRLDQEAFNAFFSRKEGAFVFKPGERTLEPRIKASVDQVLVAAFQASRPPSAA
jgi:hypothetical protein